MFKAEPYGRGELDGIVAARRANIGDVFFAAHIGEQIFGFGIFAYNHAFIDLNARIDKEPAAFLGIVESVGSGGAGFVGYNGAAGAFGNIAFVVSIAVIDVVHNTVALGVGEKLASKSD